MAAIRKVPVRRSREEGTSLDVDKQREGGGGVLGMHCEMSGLNPQVHFVGTN